eukprot:355993-Chlamydomonas_euryale.AAC.14
MADARCADQRIVAVDIPDKVAGNVPSRWAGQCNKRLAGRPVIVVNLLRVILVHHLGVVCLGWHCAQLWERRIRKVERLTLPLSRLCRFHAWYECARRSSSPEPRRN